MNCDLKGKMKESIVDFRLPRYSQITDVGLYLEQTVKLINAYLSPLGEPDITASMISNYVKKKLIPSPKKKLYYTEHIIYLMFIAITKVSASMEDIRLIFDLQREQYTLEKAYDYFCDEFENMLRSAFEISEPTFGIGDTNSDAKDLLRNMIIAVVHKIYLDKYLAAFHTLRSDNKRIAPVGSSGTLAASKDVEG